MVSFSIYLQHTLLQEALSARDEKLLLRARYRLISYRREIAQLSVPLVQKVNSDGSLKRMRLSPLDAKEPNMT